MSEFKNMSTDEILNKMHLLITTQPQTINGARGASILYRLLHEELDSRNYTAERPPRQFNPPSMHG